MKEYGIVESGDTRTMGIGAMTDVRWADFTKMAVGQGLYPADIDYKKGYTLQFVNKGYGLDAPH
jgi:NitT/TauT family transport system substrate-binding protein